MGRRQKILDAQILTAARRLFCERGYRVPTLAIADALGISEGVLYQRFGTKKALFLAAMTPAPSPVEELLGPASELDRIRTPRAAREYLVLVAERLVGHVRELVPLMIQAHANPTGDYRPPARLHDPLPIAPVLEELTARVRRLDRQGMLDAGAPRTTAEVLLVSAYGAAHLAATRGNHDHLPPDLTRWGAEVLIDQLWAGIQPRGARGSAPPDLPPGGGRDRSDQSPDLPRDRSPESPRDRPASVRSQVGTLRLDGYSLEVRTITLADRAAAQRPTLVFLHGALGSISAWRDFPKRLAETVGYDAIVYDRRGHGHSSPIAPGRRTPAYLEAEVDVLVHVLEVHGVAGAVLFGHGEGGSIALLAAARRPELVRAVVTEGAYVFVEEETLDAIRAAKEALDTTGPQAQLSRHHGDAFEVTRRWVDTWLSPAFRDWSIERYLQDVRCPVLALQGTDDAYGTPLQARVIARFVSGASREHLFAGAGHEPHGQAADEVIRVTSEFLEAGGERTEQRLSV